MVSVPNPHDDCRVAVEAALRVIARDGVSAASVDAIADEADIPVATVQYYIGSWTEFIRHVKTELYNHISDRIRHQTGSMRQDALSLILVSEEVTAVERRAALESVLSQVLPLDEQRRQDVQVWLALSMDALTRPELQPNPRIHDFYESLVEGLPGILSSAQRAGLINEQIDVSVEAERLAALLHGLALHAVLHPDLVKTETIRKVLLQHLDSISVQR